MKQEHYPIELSPTYYNNTRSKYAGNKIKFILGDSSIIFKELLPTITEPVVFFLDGHYSSGDTAKGNKDCPLIEEIINIHSLCSVGAIIIIDDFRLFGLSPKTGLAEDWSSINKTEILSILDTRISTHYHLDSECAKDDRFIIHINPKT